MQNSAKIREQLGETLSAGCVLKGTRPARGWVRSIREALGMSGRQLADRIQVDPSRITEMEKAETQGNITLKSLRRAAAAMDCELVYALVPKVTLETSVRMQAEKVARHKLDPVDHTMRLEEQGVSGEENSRQVARMVEEWVQDPPRWLWDIR